MKNKIFVIIIIAILLVILIGISLYFKNNKKGSDDNMTTEDENTITILIEDKEYNLTLEDNDTTKKLFANLPLTFQMEELNGNEKYVYLDKEYPINSYNPKHINKGDVMLYNSNCLVIFYKSFDTSYSYTKLGHIDNLENLSLESVTVTFK